MHNFALSPDKEQKFLYVVDGSNKAIRVLNRQTLEIVERLGGTKGPAPGSSSTRTASWAVDSKGKLFIGGVEQRAALLSDARSRAWGETDANAVACSAWDGAGRSAPRTKKLP